MTRDEAPKLAADNDRDGYQRLDPHIAQMFQVDRRYTAQAANGRVEPCAFGRQHRDEVGVNVCNDAQEIAFIERRTCSGMSEAG
ncbi:MAG: hypothetical protein JWL86_2101 [Rhizobium sp.]|nr:hypothetical protein [Rhizobium sp.]